MEWGAIESAIFNVAAFSWLAATVLAVIAQYKEIDYSSRVTIFLWAGFDLISLVVTPLIYELTAIDQMLTRQVWYVAFAFISLTQMVLMGYIHIRLNLYKSDLAKFVMFALVCTIFINVIRYFDRLVLETNLFGEIYKYGLMSLKLVVVSVFIKYLAKGKGVNFAS